MDDPWAHFMVKAETQLEGTGTMHVCSKAMQPGGNLELPFRA